MKTIFNWEDNFTTVLQKVGKSKRVKSFNWIGFLKSGLKSLIDGAANCSHNKRDAERVPYLQFIQLISWSVLEKSWLSLLQKPEMNLFMLAYVGRYSTDLILFLHA